MTIYTWNYPTTIYFGVGAAQQIPDVCGELDMHRPLVITDRGLLNVPFVLDIVDRCKKSGLKAGLFGDVKGNPVGANVAAGIEQYRLGDFDGIIGVGGGSALDVAKTVALIGPGHQTLWQAGGQDEDWSTLPADQIAPVIAVPTTAGTGSEVGRSAVITHETTHTKKIIFHPAMMPKRVVADPILTRDLPPAFTAATGIDAFVHCFEALCAPGYHPMAEGIALEGMRLIAEALPKAYSNGDDMDARGKMLTAATMGATAFQKDLGGVHALAHAVGSLHDLHHGLLNAVLLPYVMVVNRDVIAEPMQRLGRVLNLPAPDFDGVLAWVLALRQQLAIPHRLVSLGVSAKDAEEVARRAAADACALGNPKPLSDEDYRQIFMDALNGDLKVT